MTEEKVFQAGQNKPPKVGRWLGRLILVLGLTAGLILISPFVFLEARYRFFQWFRATEEETEEPVRETEGFGLILQIIDENSGFARVIRETDLALVNPVAPEFTVVIPKIQVNVRVTANVPVEDEAAYTEALKKGAAHAQGSYLPGEGGTVYVFGHSTDYIWNVSRFNAVFYLLKELVPGDRISVFYLEKRFEYEVTEKKIINPDEVGQINERIGEDRLVLQTCWPPGTDWQRLVVFAKPR